MSSKAGEAGRSSPAALPTTLGFGLGEPPLGVMPLPVRVVCGMGFEARVLAAHGVHPVFGLDPHILASTLDQALAAGCAGLVSFGLAGGLDPGLRPGTWVVARTVVTAQGTFDCDPGWSDEVAARLAGARRGPVAGSLVPVRNALEKAALNRESGALAVDMESAHAARLAHQYRVPLLVARVIVDPAERSLPSSAIAALRSDGGIALGALLHELVSHPLQLIGLARLARDASQAKRALVAGFELLGSRFALNR